MLTGGKAIGYQEPTEALLGAAQKTMIYQPVSMDEMGKRMEEQGNDNAYVSASHFIFFSQSLIPAAIFRATDFLNFSFKISCSSSQLLK